MRPAVFILIALMALSAYAGSASTRFEGQSGSAVGIEPKWDRKSLTVFFETKGIPVDSVPDDLSLAEILARAVAVWNSSEGGAPKFSILSRPKSERSPADVVIRFGQSLEDNQLFSGNDSDAGAFTRLFATVDGRFTRAIIILNPNALFDSKDRLSSFSMESVLVHELGHALGLTHSLSLSSLMFPHTTLSLSNLKTNLTLSEDDRNGLRSLYRGDGCCFEIRGRIEQGIGEDRSKFHVVVESLIDSRLLAVRAVSTDGTFTVKGLTSREIGIRVLNADSVLVGSLDTILSEEAANEEKIFYLDEIPTRTIRIDRRAFFGNEEFLSIAALDFDGVEGIEFNIGFERNRQLAQVMTAHFGGGFTALRPELVLDSSDWMVWRMIADSDSEIVDGEYSLYIQGNDYSIMVPGLLRIRKDMQLKSFK
jgi:hypothetical protein